MIRLLTPSQNDILLDVGGYPWFWTVVPPFVKRMDIVNLDQAAATKDLPVEYNFQILLGDGCKLMFPDKSYDVVHSNSVIEHVGDWERQKQFAAEIKRIGKSYWVQTPAREFLIEPHYLGVGVHWLPRRIQRKVNRWVTGWGWLTRPSQQQVNQMVDEIRLLSRREMEELFPEGTILVERFLGIFPKSYVAYRRASSSTMREDQV